MSELRSYTKEPNHTVNYVAYSRDELEAAWESGAQGNREAKERGGTCLVVPCDDKALAIELSAIFVREVFSMPSCCHWDGKTLSMECGQAGSDWRYTRLQAEMIYWKRMALGKWIDELNCGALFAQKE